jgi:ring-1,2-phenylacetyl-CoA epoxidase subunit PaaB
MVLKKIQICSEFFESFYILSAHFAKPLRPLRSKNPRILSRIPLINQPAMTQELPLFEVFIRSKQGLEHKHCGSLHAADATQALQMARDVYTRRMEGVSIWVVASIDITASQPEDKDEMFDPASDKIYRHPTFYSIPDAVGHM